MEITSIYSVPFWQTEYPKFEEEKQIILDTCRRYRQKNPISEYRSNVAGYQSPKFLHSQEELKGLFEYICYAANKASEDLNFIERNIFITGSWVNINDTRQAMNTSNVHGDVFSGTLYVKCPEGSGKFLITNPGINMMLMGCDLCRDKNEFTGETVKIKPEEGKIFIWPSYIPHSVETNNHDEERISISFNIIALPLKDNLRLKGN